MSPTNGRTFRTIGVVGAGNMGSGIAQKYASEALEVVLVDLDDERVARGLDIIERTLAEGVERKIFDSDRASAIRGRIRGTARFDDLDRTDLVVEAVFEDLGVKRTVFENLGRVTPPETILATNTSSFSVDDVAGAARGPDRVVGLHYFYHPAKNRLVEVVPGARTDAGVVRDAWLLQEMIGKTPIASADSAGFIVNRFFVPWLNEAVRILEENGANIPTIEAAAKKTFRVGMGPFELMNVTGVPIALHAATTLGEAFGRFYRPAPLLARQVESGDPWPLDGPVDGSKLDEVGDRLLASTFLVASALVDEGVGTIEDVDIGARVGLRWPKGPFELMNGYGIEQAATRVGELGSGFDIPMPGILSMQWRSRQPFRFRLVRSEVEDGVATLTVNRPDAMNALNETVVEQLHEAFREAADDPAVRGIVIAGAGKAFVAGADIRFFVRNIEGGSLDRIVRFTRAGHALLNDIDRSEKPVVARVHGLALGGGVELALACDRIVATPQASLAFPETGIGIYPGLGGTQRARRRVGIGLAKWLIFTGEMVGAEEACAIGLVDRVVPHAELDEAVHEALAQGTGSPNRPEPATGHRLLADFFRSADPDALLAGKAPTGSDPVLERAMKRVGRKAPIALRIASRIIDQGAEMPLEAGLDLELEHLIEIFGTRDALEGLSSLGRRAPAFEGR